MNRMESKAADAFVTMAMLEDAVARDLTTTLTVDKSEVGLARFVSQESMVVCGTEIVSKVFKAIKGVKPLISCTDGRLITKGKTIARLQGNVQSILKGERIALNFLQHLSGIATLTAKYVKKAKGVDIYDTRKTTPGYRYLEKYAVRMGGGHNHRMNLKEHILIKHPHVVAAGGLKVALQKVFPTKLKVEVEVRNFSELKNALEFPVDIIMLDNMSPANVKKAVIQIRQKGKILVEVSGGITLENVAKYASAGPDRISIGALTHSAPAVPIHLVPEF